MSKRPRPGTWTNDVHRIAGREGTGRYGFELNIESRTLARLNGCRELFQVILSQAGSYLLTGKFHDSHRYDIGKAEGGFWIPSHGEFVPTPHGVCMDSYNARVSRQTASAASSRLTDLISHIVTHWDAARHEDSMYEVAAAYVKSDANELRKAIEEMQAYSLSIDMLSRGMTFHNPISYFFGWNSHDRIPYDAKFRDYWLCHSSMRSKITPKGAPPDDQNA